MSEEHPNVQVPIPGAPQGYKPDKPAYCYQSGCPLALKGCGFAVGSGDPKTADFVVILEAIGKDEGPFRLSTPIKPRGFYDTKAECDAEIAIRRRDYPEIPLPFLSKGVPVVGKAGAALFQWLFAPFGLARPRLFIDNTLRCLPPKSGKTGTGGAYPTGDERKQAEKCCRHYDRFDKFKPDTLVFSMHPSALLREVTPLTLCIKDVEKARDFAKQGRRVMLLLGGKAVKAFARYGENITKWRGDYLPLPKNWLDFYRSLFDNTASRRIGKTGKNFAELESAMLGGGEVDMAKARRSRTRKTRRKKNAEKTESV